MLMKIFQNPGLENSVQNWNLMGPGMIYDYLIIFCVNCQASGATSARCLKKPASKP